MFFPGPVGRGGQLLNLSRHESLTNLAFKFLDTGIVSHPLLPTSGTLLVVVEQGHNVPANSSFLSRRRHNDDRTRRRKEINLKVHKMDKFVDKFQKGLSVENTSVHSTRQKKKML